jgi:hypothetical protein
MVMSAVDACVPKIKLDGAKKKSVDEQYSSSEAENKGSLPALFTDL